MTDKDDGPRYLPLGEVRDGLKDNADKILSKGQPARRDPWLDDLSDDDAPQHRGARQPLHRPSLSQRMDDERIARERAAYKPRSPFGGSGEGSGLAKGRTVPGDGIRPAGGFDDPFVRLAGITFTKRQFMTLANVELPRLLAEARAEETQRGKLLRGTLVPALLDALTDHGFIPRGEP